MWESGKIRKEKQMKKIIEWAKVIISGTLIWVSIFIMLLDYSLPIKIMALAVIFVSYQLVKEIDNKKELDKNT